MADAEPVFVLGCHRSATSLVGRMLTMGGMSCGESIPSDWANPSGYYENAAAVAFNTAVLADVRADWLSPAARLPVKQTRVAELQDLVGNELSTIDHLFIKDPRLLFTLEVWTHAVRAGQLIGVIRDPARIAASLESRNGFSMELGLDVAHEYQKRLLEIAQVLSFPLVDPEADFDHTTAVVHGVVESRGLQVARDELREAFVDGALGRRELARQAHPAFDIYDELRQRMRSGPVHSKMHASAEIRSKLQRLERRTSLVAIGPTPAGRDRIERIWSAAADHIPPVDTSTFLVVLPHAVAWMSPLPKVPAELVDVAAIDDLSSLTRKYDMIVAPGVLDTGGPDTTDKLSALTDLLTDSGIIASDAFVVAGDVAHRYWSDVALATSSDQQGPRHYTLGGLRSAVEGAGQTLLQFQPDEAGRSVLITASVDAAQDGQPTRLEIGDGDVATSPWLSMLAEGDQVQHLRDAVHAARSQLDELSAAQTRSANELSAIEADLHEARMRALDRALLLDRAVDALMEREAELLSTQESLTSAEANIHRLRKLEELKPELESAKAKLEAIQSRNAGLKRKLAESKAATKATRDRLTALQTAHDRLRNRRIVRLALGIAQPLRPLFRLRRGQRAIAARKPAPGPRQLTGSDTGEPETPPPPRLDAKPASSRRPTVTDTGPAKPASAIAPVTAEDFLWDGAGTAPSPLDVPITVIIPVFNAASELRQCLESVVLHTSAPARLFVIDDASSDHAVNDHLDWIAEFDGVTVARNPENLGFVRTVNRALAETSGDVVILNSDTIVGPSWLNRIRWLAAMRPEAASITPVSNAAGAFSVPEIGENSPPDHLELTETARLLAQRGPQSPVPAPTGNGFCMYMRRSAIEQAGEFDAEAFPRGYGEENDWCMRAAELGWEHLVDGTIYVFHHRSASFGDEKAALAAAGAERLRQLHPTYPSLARAFVRGDQMSALRSLAARALTAERPRPRVLYFLHSASGGTPNSARDLMRGVSERFEPFMLVAADTTLRLEALDENGEPVELDVFDIGAPVPIGGLCPPAVRRVLIELVRRLAIDVAHIRHLIGHGIDTPDILSELGVPIVHSLHDFYYVCPTIHLIDNDGNYCAGSCTRGQGVCEIPRRWAGGTGHLKHNWVYTWRERTAPALQAASTIVTTSRAVKDVYTKTFPDLDPTRITIVPHGRDFDVELVTVSTPDPTEPLRVLVPGNLNHAKGLDLIRAIKALDLDNQLEFLFAGASSHNTDSLGDRIEGRYRREDFPDIVKRSRAHAVGVFSITAESFSHVMSEAWALGVPLVVTDRGAQKERVDDTGAGWVVSGDNPEVAYKQLLDIRLDPKAGEVVAAARSVKSTSIGEMSTAYADIYDRVIDSVRAFA